MEKYYYTYENDTVQFFLWLRGRRGTALVALVYKTFNFFCQNDRSRQVGIFQYDFCQ